MLEGGTEEARRKRGGEKGFFLS